MFNNMFNGLFNKIAPGCCRLSYTGGIAVKTSDGSYKVWNQKKHRLVTCTNFCFPINDEAFFAIPTCKVKTGDIIIVNGKPRCVVGTGIQDNVISVVNYENSTLENILPERHVFMGRTYFYSKIYSIFNGMIRGKKGGVGNFIKMLMMSKMFGGDKTDDKDKSGIGGMFGGNNSMLNMLMMSQMFGGGDMGDLFGGMFDEDDGIDGLFTGIDNTETLEKNDEDEEDEDDSEEEDIAKPVLKPVVNPEKPKAKKSKVKKVKVVEADSAEA